MNRSKPFSEINVTPFVDVMLVLLIIFMVTAPLLTVGVQVDLPDSNADSLQSDDEPLEITINSESEIFIKETLIKVGELVPKLKAITDNKMDTKIYVRGDEGINYGGLVSGDTLTGTYSGVFDNANVASGKTVTITSV